MCRDMFVLDEVFYLAFCFLHWLKGLTLCNLVFMPRNFQGSSFFYPTWQPMAWGRSTDGREFHRKYDGLHRISSFLMCFWVLDRFIFDCTLNLVLFRELDKVFASYLGESTTPMWLVFNWVESTTTARCVPTGSWSKTYREIPGCNQSGEMCGWCC